MKVLRWILRCEFTDDGWAVIYPRGCPWDPDRWTLKRVVNGDTTIYTLRNIESGMTREFTVTSKELYT